MSVCLPKVIHMFVTALLFAVTFVSRGHDVLPVPFLHIFMVTLLLPSCYRQSFNKGFLASEFSVA